MRFSAVFAAFVLGFATISAAQTGANWSYEGKTGPLGWGKLDPAYEACSRGREQSPVDIRGAHLNKALQPIQFHYIAGSMTIENDGRTITVHPDPGSYIVAGRRALRSGSHRIPPPQRTHRQGQVFRSRGPTGSPLVRRQVRHRRRALQSGARRRRRQRHHRRAVGTPARPRPASRKKSRTWSTRAAFCPPTAAIGPTQAPSPPLPARRESRGLSSSRS